MLHPLTEDKRYHTLLGMTKYITEDRLANRKQVCCNKHGLIQGLIIAADYNSVGRLVCSQCFWEMFPEVGFPTRIIETPKLEKCNNEQCPAYVEAHEKCAFCQEHFCAAHGDKSKYTCEKCCAEVEAEIAGRHVR